MTQTWNRSTPAPVQVQRLMLLALAATLLLVGFTGNAGVQVLEHDLAVRIARLHLHGVAGEAEYVHTYAQPAPFVHPHCHGPAPEVASQPSPDEVQAAATLAGSTICAAMMTLPVPPHTAFAAGKGSFLAPQSQNYQPVAPPPQV